MRILTYCFPLLLLSSPCIYGDQAFYPGNPAVNQEGYQSPLCDAVDDMLDRFYHRDGDPDSPPDKQKLQAARQLVIQLLEKGADPNDYSTLEGLYFTPLMLAARMGDLALIEILLEKGADPNRKENRDLMTEVISSDCPDILDLLIKKGWKIDPNAPTGSVSSTFCSSLPLLTAIYDEKVKIVKALLTIGADPLLTETSPARKAKNPSEWNEKSYGWKGTDNAFDVCEKLTQKHEIEDIERTKTNQAEIKKLLDAYKR